MPVSAEAKRQIPRQRSNPPSARHQSMRRTTDNSRVKHWGFGVRDRRRNTGSLIGIRGLAPPLLALVVVVTLSPAASATTGCRTTSTNSDRDPIPDCWERRNGLVIGNRDHLTDKDRDGLLAIQEFRLDAATGGIFGPYRANVGNSDGDGGFVKFAWVEPTLDGWEDFDGDDFVNTAERAWRTNAAAASSHPDLPETGCAVVPSGVAHDGSANVSLLLQAVLDTVPDGGCLRLHAEGSYRHDGTLRIKGRNDLTIDGNGAVLITNVQPHLPPGAAKSKRPHVQILAGQNVTIENLAIDGPNFSGQYRDIFETDHAFDVRGATGLTIRNSSARQVWGDFVYVDDMQWPIHSGISVPTTGLLVSGNTFRVAGRHGFCIAGNAVGVRFEGNLVQRVHRSGVDFEFNPGRTASDVEIVGNTFRAFWLNWIAAGLGPATDIYVGFNQIEGDSMHLKMGPRNQNPPTFHERWTFEGNVSDTEHRGNRPVFFLYHVRSATFIGNVQPMYAGSAGRVFELFDTCGISLTDNMFTGYQLLFDPSEPPPC